MVNFVMFLSSSWDWLIVLKVLNFENNEDETLFGPKSVEARESLRKKTSAYEEQTKAPKSVSVAHKQSAAQLFM